MYDDRVEGGATQTIECLSCSSEVPFEPGQVERPCGVCGVVVPMPVRVGSNIPAHDMRTPSVEPSVTGRSLLQCERCKAQLSCIAAPSACPFCRSGLAARTNEWALLRPDGILPRLVTQERARSLAREEFERLEVGDELGELTAVYCPWWILSWDIAATYTGQMGMIESYEDAYGNLQTRTLWSPAGGVVERPWTGVQHHGSVGIPRSVALRLTPWDYAFVEPYEPGALGDTLCEHTVVAPMDVMARHRSEVHTEVRREVKHAIGGDKQSIGSVELGVSNERYRLLLVPVWVGRFGKGGVVAINARTGEVVVQGYAAKQVTEDDVIAVPEGETTQILWAALVVLALAGLLYWLA